MKMFHINIRTFIHIENHLSYLCKHIRMYIFTDIQSYLKHMSICIYVWLYVYIIPYMICVYEYMNKCTYALSYSVWIYEYTYIHHTSYICMTHSLVTSTCHWHVTWLIHLMTHLLVTRFIDMSRAALIPQGYLTRLQHNDS